MRALPVQIGAGDAGLLQGDRAVALRHGDAKRAGSPQQKEIEDYFAHVWQTMRACIDRGMNTEGVLHGPLRVPRRASALRRLLVASDKLSNDPMNVVDWVNMFAPP